MFGIFYTSCYKDSLRQLVPYDLHISFDKELTMSNNDKFTVWFLQFQFYNTFCSMTFTSGHIICSNETILFGET